MSPCTRQSALGDPAYMAPELFLEGMNAASFASDFWSLGCVLFELLTGEPPFGDSSYTTIDHIAREVRAMFVFTHVSCEYRKRPPGHRNPRTL